MMPVRWERAKLRACLLVACTFAMIHVAAVEAQESYRYALGTSGLKAATVPAPGKYWLFYNFVYSADQLMDPAGDQLPIDFDVYAYANAHRFVFVTDHQILGGDFSWNFAVPFVGTDFQINGFQDNSFDIGDIYVEPFVVEWHLPQLDIGIGYGFIAPTGNRSASRPSLPGKEYWTHYPVFGATYYFDEQRTWTAALLGRYEINTQQSGWDYTPGNHFNFEWGVAKSIKTLDIGVSGYCNWQVTDDGGADAPSLLTRDRSYAIGPELHYFFPKQMFGIHLRAWWEFDVRDRAKGQIVTLTFVKPF